MTPEQHETIDQKNNTVVSDGLTGQVYMITVSGCHTNQETY